MRASARLRSKRDRELLDLESAIKLLECQWTIEPVELNSVPDFIISDGNCRFGLEHTLACVDWRWQRLANASR
jgi:hypothetical protein